MKHSIAAALGVLTLAASVPAHAAAVSIFSGAQLATAESSFLSVPGVYLTESFETFGRTNYASNTNFYPSIVTSVGVFGQVTPGTGGACMPDDCGRGLSILTSSPSPFGGRSGTDANGAKNAQAQYLDSNDSRVLTFDPLGGTTRVGFFLTDPNDVGGRITLSLLDGTSMASTLGSILATSAFPNGSVHYLVFEAVEGIQRITVSMSSNADGYGIDRVSINRVPAPASLGLLGLGLVAAGTAARLRRR